MTLHTRNIYIVHNDKKALACFKTQPVTIFAFANRRIAYKMKDVLKNKDFIIYPTLANSYLLHVDHLSKNVINIDIEETCASYMSLLKNLNNVQATVIKDISQNSDFSYLLHNDEEGLPIIYTDKQMIIGNLEKMLIHPFMD